MFTVRRAGLILCFAAILAISLAPFPVKKALGTYGAFHNAGHVFVFAASASFLIYGCARLSARAARLAFVLLFAVVTEYLEARLYRNRFEWTDLMLDGLGIALSALLVYAWNAVHWWSSGRS